MRYAAIEYNSQALAADKVSTSHTLGYVDIPENFPGQWQIGFRRYLEAEKKATDINIYPLNKSFDHAGYYNDLLQGYQDMSADLKAAIFSDKYYPSCEVTNEIRAAYSAHSGVNMHVNR